MVARQDVLQSMTDQTRLDYSGDLHKGPSPEVTNFAAHSISIFNALSVLHQKACWSTTNLATSARVRSGGSSSPSLASASSHLGSFSACLASFSILSRMASGVLAGTNSPCQPFTTTSMPCSLSVGTSGSDLMRFSRVTASARRLPALIWVTAGGSEEKFIVIWPLITSASAGPVPL